MTRCDGSVVKYAPKWVWFQEECAECGRAYAEKPGEWVEALGTGRPEFHVGQYRTKSGKAIGGFSGLFQAGKWECCGEVHDPGGMYRELASMPSPFVGALLTNIQEPNL
jgi:hypothetical protein